jgi:hypothetical protein
MVIPTERLRRIHYAALTLKWLIIGAMAAIALAAIFALMGGGGWAGPHGAITRLQPGALPDADSPWTPWLGLLPKAVLLYGLYVLVRMLRSCERGDLFSPRLATDLQHFSIAIVIAELLYIAIPLQIALIRMAAGQMHGRIVLVVTSEQMWSLLLAALFMVLASLLREAALIAQENASII